MAVAESHDPQGLGFLVCEVRAAATCSSQEQGAIWGVLGREVLVRGYIDTQSWQLPGSSGKVRLKQVWIEGWGLGSKPS